jgi:hypothetical protein
VTDVNIATHEIAGNDITFLLTDNRIMDRVAYHKLDFERSITVKLGVPSYLNHINMMLDKDSRYNSLP